VVRQKSQDTALAKSVRGVKIMDIRSYLSESQISELKVVSKALTSFKETKLRSNFGPATLSFDIETAIHCVWGEPCKIAL